MSVCRGHELANALYIDKEKGLFAQNDLLTYKLLLFAEAFRTRETLGRLPLTANESTE